MKKFTGILLLAMGFVGIASGCGASRNYQTDIDSLNARISTLQGQLSAKDQEIAKLQSDVDGQRSILNQTEAEKSALRDKLNSALSDLEDAQKKALQAAKDSAKAKAASYDSDLK